MIQAVRGKMWEAVDFVNEFGPLELLDESEQRQPLRPEDLVDCGEIAFGKNQPVTKPRPVWVDVHEFWSKHRRFVAVVKLWESRESRRAMLSALSELSMFPAYPWIGARRDLHGFVPGSAFPWENGRFHEWVRGKESKQLTEAAAKIISRELNLNTERMTPLWTYPNPSRLQFRLVPLAASLWSAIWHLFARDTSAGVGWRICPHCSKVFYPKRKDSYFCDSKYQKLHAANRWWNEHSEAELDKRRKERDKHRLRGEKKARNRRSKGRK